ncbi:Trypsin-2 [Halocaridina rubra]|uniref:Trypsin-2 n=1 Tax=Halocaridina rubra TaxID=373956 RepID=A0AAN9A4I5_HALRR
MLSRITLLAIFSGALVTGLPSVPLQKGRLPKLDRIVGGVEVTPGEIPFQVSMQRDGLFGRSHSCGGSLLSSNFTITAGHCVDGVNPTKIFVVAGEHDLSVTSGDEQTRGTAELIVHEHFDEQTFTNDIALIRAEYPFALGGVIGTITLPGQMELIPPGTNCTTSGWGATVEGGTIPDILRKVDVPIVSDSVCRQSYGVTDIGDHMLCAGLAEGGKDSCQGDSGGPLVCNGTLHGLTSWGYGCARPNFPGVYTEVAYFRDWLDSKLVI